MVHISTLIRCRLQKVTNVHSVNTAQNKRKQQNKRLTKEIAILLFLNRKITVKSVAANSICDAGESGEIQTILCQAGFYEVMTHFPVGRIRLMRRKDLRFAIFQWILISKV